MSSFPYVDTSNVFNTADYRILNEGLTRDTADKLYLSLGGGLINGNLNINGTLSLNGSAIDLSLISGVTAGTPQASKALSLNALSQIDGSLTLTGNISAVNINSSTLIASSTLTLGATSISETEIGYLDGVTTAGTIYASKVITVNSSSQLNSSLQLATSRKILMNNSASALAYIDMGNTASDRCISLFSDAVSYYGFGANSSNLRSFSKDSFAWYTGATQSVIGTSIMTLNSAGLLTTASLTATSITGTLQTAAQPNITSIGTLASLTATNITGTLQTAAQPNITSIGTLASLTATSITGTLQTAAQPNITSIGTLASLTATSITGTLQTAAQPNITSIGTLTSLNVSGVSSTSTTQITTTANYSGIMDTASIVLKQASVTNGNKIGIDFMISTNAIDAVNTATCSIVHERILAYVGDLVFNTKRIGWPDAPLTEALRISSTGTCSIANTSSGFQLNLGGSGTGINTNALTTTSLTFGATAITATGIELNYLDLTTGTGTAEASKALVLDSSKNIATINNLGMSGVLTMTAANTTLSMTVPNSGARSNFVWNGDTGVQWEYGMRGSSNTPANALYWYSGGHRMILFNGGQLTVGGQQTPSTQTLQVNHATGSCLRMTYNLTSNKCDMSVSSGGILTIAPSGSVTAISGTTGSTSNTTGALTLSGGIGISLTTDATSITNGGSFTTAGGIAVAKSVWCGGTITVNKSTSSSLFAGYSGTANFSVSGLLNTSITIGTGSNNDLNIMTGNTTAMTIDGMNQSISGIGSLTATDLYGLIGTPAQTSITSLGTLTALTVSGLTTTGTLNLGGTLITATGAELNYCDLTGSAGTAEASKVLTLDASKNIATLNSLTSNYLVINTAINSGNCLASFGALNVGPIVTSYGISSIKGTASYPSVYFGSTNSILWAEGSHPSPIEFEIGISSLTKATSTNGARIGTMTLNDLSFNTNAVERMLIRSSGAVAIKNYLQVGDSTDTSRLISALDNSMTASTLRYLTLGKANSNGNQAEIAFLYVADNDDTNALTMGFYGGEKMRLTRYGSLLINSTSNVYSGTKTRLAAEAPGATDWVCCFKNTSAANNKCMGFINNSASEVGSITWGTGTTSFNTTSDYRLKKNIKPLTNCLELLNKLNPVRYNWINDYNEEAEGFIAHELQEILPLIVVGKKDAVYEDGSINPQSIDYGKLTPHLVAAVKELTDINIALSKKIEDLESKVKNILSYEELNKHIKLITKQVLKDYTVE